MSLKFSFLDQRLTLYKEPLHFKIQYSINSINTYWVSVMCQLLCWGAGDIAVSEDNEVLTLLKFTMVARLALTRQYTSNKDPKSVLLFKILSVTIAFCYGTYRIHPSPLVALCLNKMDIHLLIYSLFFQQISFEWFYCLTSEWQKDKLVLPSSILWPSVWDNMCMYITMMLLYNSYRSSDKGGNVSSWQGQERFHR